VSVPPLARTSADAAPLLVAASGACSVTLVSSNELSILSCICLIVSHSYHSKFILP
jgi:hypothetical protein